MFIYISIFVIEMRLRDFEKENHVKQKALEMLVNEGFDGFSMQKLAKSAEVSPGTLYIYFKDKEDLIIQLGKEEGLKMTESTFKNFNPEMSLSEGLWIQWQNRKEYWLNNTLSVTYFDQVKLSKYRDKISESITTEFRLKMSPFLHKAIKMGELIPLKSEVFWAIAFAPLYNLVRFHLDGKNMGNGPYELKDDDLKSTFDLVIKALKP